MSTVECGLVHEIRKEDMILDCYLLIFVQKRNRNLMTVVRFRFIVCKLAFQRIQLHFGMLNFYKQRSSLNSLQQLTIA